MKGSALCEKDDPHRQQVYRQGVRGGLKGEDGVSSRRMGMIWRNRRQKRCCKPKSFGNGQVRVSQL